MIQSFSINHRSRHGQNFQQCNQLNDCLAAYHRPSEPSEAAADELEKINHRSRHGGSTSKFPAMQPTRRLFGCLPQAQCWATPSHQPAQRHLNNAMTITHGCQRLFASANGVTLAISSNAVKVRLQYCLQDRQCNGISKHACKLPEKQ